MATLTGTRTRTITGHLANLLEYPKWLIERDIDFTDCEFDGSYDATLTPCKDCRFGIGCKWLNSIRDIDANDASLMELTNALHGAVSYVSLAHPDGHRSACECETCAWLASARRMLRSLVR